MKTEPTIKVIVCEHTQNEVLFDIKANICLHLDSIEQDKREVNAFILENNGKRIA